MKASRFVVAALSVATAVYSLRFAAVPFGLWPQVDTGIRGMIEVVPWPALTHTIAAPLALLAGPFQFWPGLRARRPLWHRVTGRVYVAACLVGGVAALATAPHASGGPVAAAGFGLLAALWLAATLAAWRAARARNFALHRALMRYSFAMTFGAVTLRLQIPLFFVLGYPGYAAMSVWLAWTAWVPNVLAVSLYGLLSRRQPQSTFNAVL